MDFRRLPEGINLAFLVGSDGSLTLEDGTLNKVIGITDGDKTKVMWMLSSRADVVYFSDDVIYEKIKDECMFHTGKKVPVRYVDYKRKKG